MMQGLRCPESGSYIFFKCGFYGNEKARDLHTNLTCFSLGIADKCSFTDCCLPLVTWPGCIERELHGYSWNSKCLCHWEGHLYHLSMSFMKAKTVHSASLQYPLSTSFYLPCSWFMEIELVLQTDVKSWEIAILLFSLIFL